MNEEYPYRIETSIHIGYSATRNWREWEAIREFVQNSLDAVGKANVYRVGNDLKISDAGAGFKARHLLIGRGEKSPCDRGMYGEGMKLACLALLALGYKVKIETTGIEIIPYIETKRVYEPTEKAYFEEKVLAFRYREAPEITGTTITIYNYTGPTFDDRFNLETNKKILFKGEISYCEGKPYPNYIIEETPARLYVRNIYVKELENAEFSYDLFDVRLSPSRDIPSEYDVTRCIGRLWEYVNDVNLMIRFFNAVKQKKYESNAKIWWIARENQPLWKQAFKTVFGENRFIGTSREAARRAAYFSSYLWREIDIVIPEDMRSAFISFIETDVWVIKHFASMRPKIEVVLNPAQRANLSYLKRITDLLAKEFFPKLSEWSIVVADRESMGDTAGLASGDTKQIFIREDILNSLRESIGVLVEELTHAVEKTMDTTDEHQIALSKIAGIVAYAVKKLVISRGAKW